MRLLDSFLQLITMFKYVQLLILEYLIGTYSNNIINLLNEFTYTYTL